MKAYMQRLREADTTTAPQNYFGRQREVGLDGQAKPTTPRSFAISNASGGSPREVTGMSFGSGRNYSNTIDMSKSQPVNVTSVRNTGFRAGSNTPSPQSIKRQDNQEDTG